MHLDARRALAVGLGGLAVLPSAMAAASKPKNAILLSNVSFTCPGGKMFPCSPNPQVQTLTLRAGKMTSHRRVAAVKQLSCVAHPQAICDLYTVDAMRCTNQGSAYDDDDIQWSCTATLPPELKLGSTEVSCEGYSASDDPYILKGSCAVEYRLLLTDYGEQRYPELATASRSGGGPKGWEWVFIAAIVALIAYLIYSAYQSSQQRQGRGGGGGGGGFWGGGGGGGGGGGFDPGFGPGNDPPPPYPGTKPPDSQQGWRPGFWSGLAGGAAAGYMAGNRGGNRNMADDRYYGGGRFDDRPVYQPARASSSGGGVSSARHTSTGFGSTTRR